MISCFGRKGQTSFDCSFPHLLSDCVIYYGFLSLEVPEVFLHIFLIYCFLIVLAPAAGTMEFFLFDFHLAMSLEFILMIWFYFEIFLRFFDQLIGKLGNLVDYTFF